MGGSFLYVGQNPRQYSDPTVSPAKSKLIRRPARLEIVQSPEGFSVMHKTLPGRAFRNGTMDVI